MRKLSLSLAALARVLATEAIHGRAPAARRGNGHVRVNIDPRADEERIAKAEAKRARKAAKRLRAATKETSNA